MNILLLTYQGDIAGSTLSISYLAKGLKERGHNVYVGCRKEAKLVEYLENSGVKIIPMVFRSKRDFKNALHIKTVCDKYNIQLINAQSSKDRYTSIIAKKWYGAKAKVVFTRRQISRSIGGPQSWLYQWGSDKIVAVSNGVKESLLKNGISYKHIEVIHNGTPCEKYKSIDRFFIDSARKNLGLSKNDFVVGCISRYKQQDQLIAAVQEIKDPLVLLFIGIRKERLGPLDQLEKLGHRIICLGEIPSAEALQYYQILDVKVLPSITEGLSQSLLEAMYLKTPVIATAAAGNLDLIEDGKNGLLFENGNIHQLSEKIKEIRTRPELKTRLIDNAFITASEDYSIKNTIDKYEKFFERLISS